MKYLKSHLSNLTFTKITKFYVKVRIKYYVNLRYTQSSVPALYDFDFLNLI